MKYYDTEFECKNQMDESGEFTFCPLDICIDGQVFTIKTEGPREASRAAVAISRILQSNGYKSYDGYFKENGYNMVVPLKDGEKADPYV